MRLVTLGGAALRLTPPGTERLETARRLEVGVTGPECNAAVAAGRLGSEAAWLSRLPDGPLGRRVAAELRGHEVEVVADLVDGRQGLTFFERGPEPRGNDRLDDLAGAAVEGLTMDDLPDAEIEAADVAYVTAATPVASNGLAGTTAKFLKTATDAGATTALGLLDVRGWEDRGTGQEAVEGLFPVVDVLVGTADAVATVFDRDGEPGGVMHALASEHGLETVALSHDRGAAVWHEATVHELAAPDVDVVDVSGSADAFAGAFLAGLAGGDVQSALRRAVAASALARTTPGALPAFTAAEVDRVAQRVGRD
jgi:2-dehydro-3-deoxygluconokinase